MFIKRSLSLLVVAAAVLWGPASALSQATTSLKERWKLELMPQQVPPHSADISGTAWAQANPRNILGVGTDFALVFPASSAIGNLRPQVHFTTIRYPSVNDRSSPIIETTEKYAVAIDGPFLEYGGVVRSFFADKDDRLVLDAVIRVGDRKWYHLESHRVDLVGKLKGNVEITEHLFEFQHDPLIEEHGDVTVHRHVRKQSHDRGETLHTPWQFTSKRRSNDREKYCSVEVMGKTLTFFDKEGQYAALGKDSMGGTGVFRKLPEAQPAAQRNP